MAAATKTFPYVLGIDLGAHSLGWAVLPLDSEGKPRGITALGVRTFEAGVEASYDQMMEGKQKSRAAARREKRGPRRQFWRRAWRRYKVLKCLIRQGFLRDPVGLNLRNPADQDRFIKSIDAELRERLRPALPKRDPGRHLWEQRWLYELRASALDRQLDPLELGRVLYHLAQRRGFLSNRKTDTPDDDESPKRRRARRGTRDARGSLDANASENSQVVGSESSKEDTKKVKQQIEQLTQDMQRVGAPTLGVYFARHVDPEERRIRQRWTSRAMYHAEFREICDKQAKYYLGLGEKGNARGEIRDAIFYQRPLKPVAHLVGHCDLEPGRKRALQSLPIPQRFRLLQRVNDLKVTEPNGRERCLGDDERAKLIDALSTQGDMTFARIRELLGFRGPRTDRKTGQPIPGHTFNLERPPVEKLPGDRTAAKILACDERAPGVAERWRSMSGRQRDELVLALVEFENDGALARHVRERFGFSEAQAAALAKVKLEQSRCLLSHRAIERLLPYMEAGMPFATAKEQLAEYRAKAVRQAAALDLLPRVLATDHRHVPAHGAGQPSFKNARDLRNPAVTRALAELRKVVNAIIRHYGKPARIHVELARELKKTPRQREQIAKNNERGRDARAKAVAQMQAEIGLSNPSDNDKRKWLLGLEQNWHCPYCGKPLERAAVASGELQIDHIIPESISLDGNWPNLVLCHAACNLRKGKRAPCHAFGEDELNSIARFTAGLPPAKRRRFQWTEDDIREHYADESGGFTRRQLQDTQYSSRLAAEYLGMLYGGVVDEIGARRVQVSSGAVTGILRREWGLNAVIPGLPDSPARSAPAEARLDEKLRTDHRHHAVDAIVIALTGPSTVKMLADAARTVEDAELQRKDVRDSRARRRSEFAEIPPPWGTADSFVETVRAAIADVRVSRRAERKIQGPLHAETNYSREIVHNGQPFRRQRVKLTELSARDIEGDVIADPVVRAAVRAKWRELGCDPPRKAFASETTHPVLRARNGHRGPPIHTVRINVSITPVTVGHGPRQRFVVSGKDTLHHTIIVAERTRSGERWRDHPVDRLEVLRRRRDGRPIVQTDWGRDQFVMCLCKDDCIEMDDGAGRRALYVVKAISKRDIKVRLHQDARTDEQINAVGERNRFRITSADTLRRRNAVRVVVDPLGNVQRVARGHV